MTSFPYELVYEHLARAVLKKGLPKEDLEPTIFMVVVKNGKIAAVDPTPVGPLFADDRAKLLVRSMIGKALTMMPADACIVLMSEAFTRRTDIQPNETTEEMMQRHGVIPGQLDKDSSAQECLMFQLYRPGETRVGTMPIRHGRVLEYAPMETEKYEAVGRLVPAAAREKHAGPIMPHFEDAKEQQRLHPSTFEAPNDEDLAEIRVGWHVKVCCEGERFWVKVFSLGDTIKGTIDNHLVRTHKHGLRDGDMITFERRNVYQIQRPGPSRR